MVDWDYHPEPNMEQPKRIFQSREEFNEVMSRLEKEFKEKHERQRMVVG